METVTPTSTKKINQPPPPPPTPPTPMPERSAISTPSPIRSSQTRKVGFSFLQPPPTGFNPDFTQAEVDYLLVDKSNSEVLQLNRSQVMKIILNSTNPPVFEREVTMYVPSQTFGPAHFPQMEDAGYLPLLVRVLLLWALTQGDAPCNESVNLFALLERWLDPPSLLPTVIPQARLLLDPITIQHLNYSHAVLGIRVVQKLRHLSLRASWDEVRERGVLPGENARRMTTMSVFPEIGWWSQELDSWMEEEDKELTELKQTSNLKPNMNFIYWNSRGIGRPTFTKNLRELISVNHPELLIVSETRCCMRNTEHIVKRLPYDSWKLVDPVGFAGGILLLWNSRTIAFDSIGENAQGLHGVVKGATEEYGTREIATQKQE